MKINEVINKMRQDIPTISGFSDKKEIPNPLNLETNPEPYLVNGWGLAIGESEIGLSEFNSILQAYNIGVVLSRNVGRTEGNTDRLFNMINAIYEDAIAVQKFYHGQNNNLTPYISGMNYMNTSAVESLGEDDHGFITLTVNFTVMIEESL